VNKKPIKTAPLPGMPPLGDAAVRIPGRAAELMRLAMMHDPGTRDLTMKAMLGIICVQYAEKIIAERGVSVPAHLMDCKIKGGAR
jgi:hypothetical protein